MAKIKINKQIKTDRQIQRQSQIDICKRQNKIKKEIQIQRQTSTKKERQTEKQNNIMKERRKERKIYQTDDLKKSRIVSMNNRVHRAGECILSIKFKSNVSEIMKSNSKKKP